MSLSTITLSCRMYSHHKLQHAHNQNHLTSSVSWTTNVIGHTCMLQLMLVWPASNTVENSEEHRKRHGTSRLRTTAGGEFFSVCD
ncbi:hypothetical protein BJ165DRAFT_1483115 [Panaeolus papilionaceus]|nr:hypothetical protein BJ165DRAFT_1483115 [Panaeolus papilionaceus]